MMNNKDEITLKKLNDNVSVACKERTDFLNSKMEEYAKVKIGEDMYHLETGKMLGKVTEYYRYHQDDIRHDDTMSIHYKFDNGDNTSRQSLYSFQIGNMSDLIKSKEDQLCALMENKQ